MSSKTESRMEIAEAEAQALLEQETSPAPVPSEDTQEEQTYRRPHIGQLLKELRGPISLRELHRQTGIAVAHLSQIESGLRNPGVSVLRRLAEFHDVDLHQLLEQAGHLTTEPADLEEDDTANIERAYRYVTDDPRIRTVVKPDPSPPLDTQRFIVELYERITKRTLL